MRRRGEAPTGSPAAALIGIITLLIIFYILFLPPEERKALLEEQPPGEAVSAPEILLNVPVGRLTFVGRNTFDHPLPNLALIETRNAAILHTENPFTIRKGWFSRRSKIITFTVPDFENTENIILSFQAPIRRGILHLVLNGVTIFESPVLVQNPPPVTLPKGLLNKTNTLEFHVTGGLFERKTFSFTDVKIIGDITDVMRQQATNTFTVTDTEYDNFETGYLDFYPICEQEEVGVLEIQLNGKIVYAAVPACESPNRQDLYREDLRPGKNTLLLKITKGSYRVEQIRARTILKPVKAFIDFFNVNATLENDVQAGRRKVVLDIEFVDDGRPKQAETNINGRRSVIDQRTARFTRDLSNVIREGNNYIELKPLTELNILKLEIRSE